MRVHCTAVRGQTYCNKEYGHAGVHFFPTAMPGYFDPHIDTSVHGDSDSGVDSGSVENTSTEWKVNPEIGFWLTTSDGQHSIDVCGKCGAIVFTFHKSLHESWHNAG